MKVRFTGWPVFGLFLTVFLTAYASVLLSRGGFVQDIPREVAADDPIDPPPDSLVVDMGKLLRQAQRDDRQQ